MPKHTQTITVPELENPGLRLDAFLAQQLPVFSRSQIQKWLKAKQVTLNGEVTRAKTPVYGGEVVGIEAELPEILDHHSEAMTFDVIFEDEHLLIINKPANLVVHPGAGNPTGTLLNGLLHHAPELKDVPRAGIVHRLDKDTTGLLMIAKSHASHTRLVADLQERLIKRQYLAIVKGVMTSGLSLDKPIGRHPKQRIKMAVMPEEMGKPAITHVRVKEKYTGYCQLHLELETGRTHQIRVHLADHGYPIVGDGTYGGRLSFHKGLSEEVRDVIRQFKRQALHAYRLQLTHPISEEVLSFEAPLPEDLSNLIQHLQSIPYQAY